MDNQRDAANNDPRMRVAYDHLQAGRWPEAIAAFTALVQSYPADERLRKALDTARLKASFEASTRVNVRRYHIPWRVLIFRVLATMTILAVLAGGAWLVVKGVIPALSQARVERHRAALLSQGNAFLLAEDLDNAEESFTALLQEVPEHPEALAGMQKIQAQREIQALYQQGVALQEQGDWAGALEAFTKLQSLSPAYRDSTSRIALVSSQRQIEQLFNEAESAFSNGENLQALEKYQQVQTLSATYKAADINERLFTIYMRMGRALVEKRPTTSNDISQAANYFTQALIYRPRDPGALQEQRYAALFSSGMTAYQNARWHDAAFQLRTLYEANPDYLGTTVVEMLYDAYIRSGDLYLQDNDLYRAYDAYLSATRLPVQDTTLAMGRLEQVKPNITPTIEPTATATPRPTSAGGSGGATAKPRTATPTPTAVPEGLAGLRNKIIFMSANPGQTGLWSMSPDGSNRQFLGNSAALMQQYEDLVRKYQYSPDQSSMVYVRGPNESAQIFVTFPSGTRMVTNQITNQKGANYDPSWSPDGQRIVYVSEDTGSDDIWVMATDGSGKINLTPTSYYEKRPSWSPNGDAITFWSDRAGGKQIFVMNADGSGVRNISNSPWEEYDPVWVR